jgi:hypothetical protein
MQVSKALNPVHPGTPAARPREDALASQQGFRKQRGEALAGRDARQAPVRQSVEGELLDRPGRAPDPLEQSQRFRLFQQQAGILDEQDSGVAAHAPGNGVAQKAINAYLSSTAPSEQDQLSQLLGVDIYV